MWFLSFQDDGSSFMLRFFHLLGVVMVASLINALRKGYQVRKRFQALKD
jgi:hypothetical protein